MKQNKQKLKFTDDDLKRLKKDKESWAVTRDIVDALLARLEAAESCLVDANCICPEETHYKSCTFTKRYEAWRKACGRV